MGDPVRKPSSSSKESSTDERADSRKEEPSLCSVEWHLWSNGPNRCGRVIGKRSAQMYILQLGHQSAMIEMATNCKNYHELYFVELDQEIVHQSKEKCMIA